MFQGFERDSLGGITHVRQKFGRKSKICSPTRACSPRLNRIFLAFGCSLRLMRANRRFACRFIWALPAWAFQAVLPQRKFFDVRPGASFDPRARGGHDQNQGFQQSVSILILLDASLLVSRKFSTSRMNRSFNPYFTGCFSFRECDGDIRLCRIGFQSLFYWMLLF